MTKEIKTKEIDSISSEVVSRLLSDPYLTDKGFVSYVVLKFENIFFDWGKCLKKQLISYEKEKENYNLYYVTDLFNSESGQVVNLLSRDFIQINPSFIVSSETAKQTDVLLKNSGGTLWEVKDLESLGIQRLDANFKKLTLNDGKIIYIQKTWGNKWK